MMRTRIVKKHVHEYWLRVDAYGREHCLNAPAIDATLVHVFEDVEVTYTENVTIAMFMAGGWVQTRPPGRGWIAIDNRDPSTSTWVRAAVRAVKRGGRARKRGKKNAGTQNIQSTALN